MSWVAGEVNYDLDYYEVEVVGVDTATTRMQDTRSTIVIKGVPPENVTVQVTAVSQCGQSSNPVSEMTNVDTVSPGKAFSPYPFPPYPCNTAVFNSFQTNILVSLLPVLSYLNSPCSV